MPRAIMDYYPLLRPLLHTLAPEAAHRAAIHALRLGVLPSAGAQDFPSLRTALWGLAFSNPVGLAAGFDKNAEAVSPLFRQGFGFVEAGTVTPRSQPGNPKPRMFRLPQDEAVINRLGFNSAGWDVMRAQLQALRERKGVLGINIGKNRDSKDAAEDYVTLLTQAYAYADYITVNISSPNTAGLRDLQRRAPLEALLRTLMQARMAQQRATGRHVPLLLKIAPDLDAQGKQDIAAVALAEGLDGLIISNTTLARPDHLRGRHTHEQGGLSGKPLFALSTAVLADMRRLTQGRIPLIGVGGVASGADAYAKIRAGASLVQLYSALVYQGFGLVQRIITDLAALLERDGFTHISQAVGADH